MTRLMKSFYHFLGGVKFALILIACAAGVVIIGTVIESKTSSHLLASKYTYDHLFFQLLLFFFFINILFSALRRWPFKKRHVPFLITHLGLLMIISGIIIKNRYGVQGHLTIWEGSSNNQLVIPNSYALHIETELLEHFKITIPLPSLQKQYYSIPDIPHLSFEILGSIEHVTQRYDAWIKGNKASIRGFAKLSVYPWKSNTPFPLGQLLTISNAYSKPWRVTALRSPDYEHALKTAYLSNVSIKLSTASESKEIRIIDYLNQPIDFNQSKLCFEMTDLSKIKIQIFEKDNTLTKLYTLATDVNSDLIAYDSNQQPCPFQIDLIRPEISLTLVQDTDENVHFMACDDYGRIFYQVFDMTEPQQLLSYDNGFAGYGISATIPFSNYPANREALIKATEWQLYEDLNTAFLIEAPLVPFLEKMRQKCAQHKIDFSASLIDFLKSNKIDDLHQENRQLLKLMSFENYFDNDYLWIKSNLKQCELDYNSLMNVEKQQHTPLILLSNYWKKFASSEHPLMDSICLETSVNSRLIPEEALIKIEDNYPGLLIEGKNGTQKQVIALKYDATLTALKWPVLGGKYLMRFQPATLDIPYKIRLRQARQLLYPDSTQTYSYECDLLVSEKDRVLFEGTISMNQVYETWTGYRFYLASIATSADQTLKCVQLIVNYNPTKYWLIYPGILLVFLGALSLFWGKIFKKI